MRKSIAINTDSYYIEIVAEAITALPGATAYKRLCLVRAFVRGADGVSPSDKGADSANSHDVPVQLTGSSKRGRQTGQS